LRGINREAVYARKGKYDLYGRKVLRMIFPRKQINPDKKAFEISCHFENRSEAGLKKLCLQICKQKSFT